LKILDPLLNLTALTTAYNFDVLSTKEQLVDECLGEAFLGEKKKLHENTSIR
jgi:hypothetical protein